MATTSLSDRLFGRRNARSSALARRPAPVPWALALMIPAICVYYVAAFLLVDRQAPIELAAMVMISFGIVNALLCGAIFIRLRGYELPSEQRRHVRIDVDLDGTLDGAPCRVADLSLGGAGVHIEAKSAIAAGDECNLDFAVHGEQFAMKATVLRRTDRGGASVLALRYREGQGEAVSRIAMALLSEAPGESEAAAEPLPLSA